MREMSANCAGPASRCQHELSRNSFLFLIAVLSFAPSTFAATNAVLLEFRQQVECTHPQKFLTISNGLELPLRTTLRTRERAAALIRLADSTVLRVNEHTELELFDPEEGDQSPLVHLLFGSIFSHSRNRTGGVRIRSGAVNAVSTGTDFEMIVEDGRKIYRVFDGAVRVTSAQGQATASNGWQIVVLPGAGPLVQPIVVSNLVQWWLHYPAALDLREVSFGEDERQAFAKSIAAWEKGNIRAAIESWTNVPALNSLSAKTFAAAIEFAAGRIDRAEVLLSGLGERSVSDGTRAVLAAATLRDWNTNLPPASASAWLGLSWWKQSQRDIGGALTAAREATQRSPQWGLAWARQAELEFSSGETRSAARSLSHALLLAPEYAPAHALRGFVFAAENRDREAIAAFDEALRLDGLLGDAWLGRGLCLIRSGRGHEGRIALQNAVGAQPERSSLRSYLGKAWDQTGNAAKAHEELSYAARLDAGDPTPSLYSALLNEREHHYNEAVRDLEYSIALNDNRAVYRSELLLDEDRAVRGANLARLYDRAGLTEVGVREAARAVNIDYANWSSHLFLAQSYDALRDPARVNLRYETPWAGELFLARLLAPAVAGAFSQNISQQEYTRLFEMNRVGLSSSSEWRSDGRYRERASQYGIFGGTSWTVDLDWERREEQHHLNNELDRLEIYPQLKQQVTASDSLLLFAKIYDYRAGDLRQLERRGGTDRTLENRVEQLPIVAAGWHHEWAPRIHTLLLGARLEDDQRVRTDALGALGLYRPTPGPPLSVETNALGLRYSGKFEIWSAELNQIIEVHHHTFVAGVRGQSGEFDTRDVLRTNAFTGGAASFFDDPATRGHAAEDFSRLAIYAYDHYEITKDMLLIGGVTYDRIEFPRNFAAPPISGGTRVRDAVEPKGGVVWSPFSAMTLRGMYAQSLGGASLDESFRLEPSQIAGFPQAYRSLLSESAGAGSSAQLFELWGAAVDLKLATNTWLGLEGTRRESDEANTMGVFQLGGTGNYTPVPLPQNRRYEESMVGVALHQLLGDSFSASTGWRFTRSELDEHRFSLPASFGAAAHTKDRADLHELWFRIVFNHPSGLFARSDVLCFWQESAGSTSASRDETVCELNLLAGWRFKHQRGEISAGVLNVTDAQHRLNPLNALAELPRERVFVTQLRLNF